MLYLETATPGTILNQDMMTPSFINMVGNQYSPINH